MRKTRFLTLTIRAKDPTIFAALSANIFLYFLIKINVLYDRIVEPVININNDMRYEFFSKFWVMDFLNGSSPATRVVLSKIVWESVPINKSEFA